MRTCNDQFCITDFQEAARAPRSSTLDQHHVPFQGVLIFSYIDLAAQHIFDVNVRLIRLLYKFVEDFIEIGHQRQCGILAVPIECRADHSAD